MKTMTMDEYWNALKAQGTKKHTELCMICPMCGTVQNGADLIAAGAGKTWEDVEQYVGWSCVGRWTHGKPPPTENVTQEGCNWTLGGLFHTHTMEVIDEDGKKHPRFEVATPEQSKAHLSKSK